MIVSLDEMKTHLRVTDTSEDALIQDYILAAEEYIENFINRPIPGVADNPQAIPKSIKAAAMLFVTNLYENRGDNVDGDISVYNRAIQSLIYPYRVKIGI